MARSICGGVSCGFGCVAPSAESCAGADANQPEGYLRPRTSRASESVIESSMNFGSELSKPLGPTKGSYHLFLTRRGDGTRFSEPGKELVLRPINLYLDRVGLSNVLTKTRDSAWRQSHPQPPEVFRPPPGVPQSSVYDFFPFSDATLKTALLAAALLAVPYALWRISSGRHIIILRRHKRASPLAKHL